VKLSISAVFRKVPLDPGEPSSVELKPPGVPTELCAATYCDRLVRIFQSRNPFYE
jgi:hypothetical protein